MNAHYLLRRRADKDGFTLMRNEIAVSGGSISACLDHFCNANDAEDITITKDVVRTMSWHTMESHLSLLVELRKCKV